MSELQIGALILVATLAVLFSGLPIAWGLALVSIVFLALFGGEGALATLAITMMGELSSFALLTIPLFILLGASVGVSRAGADIFESLHRWLARLPGGLVIANIYACGLFSAICGSSPATAAAIGKIGVPEMIKRGVSPRLATGAICAGGTLGILIPPSVTLILYGIATETSIGRLFLAGVVPGVLLTTLFALYAWAASIRDLRARAQPEERYTLAQKMDGLVRVLPFLLIIAAVAVFMYGGLATPSEVAAIAAFLALMLVLLIYRAWKPRDLWAIYRDTVRESTMIMMIIGAAALFSYMMSLLYVSQTVADALVSMAMNRWVLLAAIQVLLLFAGCFLPPVAIILMLMPILQPVLEANGFDLIWFGILLTINLEIGLITPPVGLNLYVLRGVAPQVPLAEILWGSLPFVLLMIGFMVLLCLVPELATWLPDALMGRGL
ncbi:TRAP transporter large permease [Elioraea sp. Yellowstone]|uniref:TRAP transporter large permease n=1 Tax=Elioraea sp. Yellowstone TaxID=2592070 RepID=UPI00115243E2|nr:TRAP transporter large permease [Elioraea sp. Yellowstone]TQF79520.1 TRAP transporter large permease [Elioraea sp. Yellowstone]